MNVELDKAIRLYDFITMGELVAYDALNRNESVVVTSVKNTRLKKEKLNVMTKTSSM